MIAKLKVNHCEDRASLVSILAFAGYKVSIQTVKEPRYSLSGPDYFVIVEQPDEPKEGSHAVP
jgi:hypothetical protein